jgi:solute carrier family 35 protein E3
MCVGVTVATVNDVQVEPFGLFIGLLAILGAVQQQILIGKMQKELGASANQLLVAYTPYAYTVLFLISPIDLLLPDNANMGFGAYNDWIDNHFSTASATTIVLSGCLGLLVSLSTYLLIGHTSALTYNIVGHLKTCCILFSGWLFFAEPMSMGKLFGISTALVGVIWYVLLCADRCKALLSCCHYLECVAGIRGSRWLQRRQQRQRQRQRCPLPQSKTPHNLRLPSQSEQQHKTRLIAMDD